VADSDPVPLALPLGEGVKEEEGDPDSVVLEDRDGVGEDVIDPVGVLLSLRGDVPVLLGERVAETVELSLEEGVEEAVVELE
jgi:hypothetical protein